MIVLLINYTQTTDFVLDLPPCRGHAVAFTIHQQPATATNSCKGVTLNWPCGRESLPAAASPISLTRLFACLCCAPFFLAPQAFDVSLLDQVITTAYNPTHPSRNDANTILMALQANADMWTRSDAILEQSKVSGRSLRKEPP